MRVCAQKKRLRDDNTPGDMTQAPTYHNMQRRMVTHNYALPGIYHITLHVAEGMGQSLGQVEGALEQPDNTTGGPHVMLTSIGKMVREELRSPGPMPPKG